MMEIKMEDLAIVRKIPESLDIFPQCNKTHALRQGISQDAYVEGQLNVNARLVQLRISEDEKTH